MILGKSICYGLELKPRNLHATRKAIAAVPDDAIVIIFGVEKRNLDTGVAEQLCKLQHGVDMAYAWKWYHNMSGILLLHLWLRLRLSEGTNFFYFIFFLWCSLSERNIHVILTSRLNIR